MRTKPLVQRIVDFDTVSLAASQKIRNRASLISASHIDTDADAASFVDINKDHTLGPGYWVKAWLFVSQSEAESAEDPTP
jgi:hypothetical protein